jgi:putative FmdB family regulatory protein
MIRAGNREGYGSILVRDNLIEPFVSLEGIRESACNFDMPIFEYSCEDCGTKFEKLVRRAAEASELNCPSCGHAHLHQEYSMFSAQSGGAKEVQPTGGCGGDMCDTGFCGGGMCGMN